MARPLCPDPPTGRCAPLQADLDLVPDALGREKDACVGASPDRTEARGRGVLAAG